MKELIQKWQQLQPRERYLVSPMVAMGVIALFYVSIWAPLHEGVEQAKLTVTSQQKSLTWMQNGVTQILQSKGTRKPVKPASGSLSQRVSKTASSHQIQLTRIQPQKEELNVRIDSVSFDDFLAWLQTMQQQGIEVTSVDLDGSDQAGIVEVRKIILRSAS